MATPRSERKLSRTKATRNPAYEPVSIEDISSRGSFRIRGGRDLAVVCLELDMGPDDFGIDEALYAKGMSARLSHASSSSSHQSQELASSVSGPPVDEDEGEEEVGGPTTHPLGRQQEEEVGSAQPEAEEEDNDEKEIQEAEHEVVEETVGCGGPVDSNGDDDDDDDDGGVRTKVVDGEVLWPSPNGKFRRAIRPWTKGRALGNGSFGTVFEGMGP